MSGQVYLCFDGSGLWKIGIASDPDKRLRQMKTGNATIRMPLHVPVDNPVSVEAELHNRFDDRRVSGEWFDLEPQDLHYIYNRLLGNGNTHGFGDFVILHDIINKQKKASNYMWLQDLDEAFASIENE